MDEGVWLYYQSDLIRLNVALALTLYANAFSLFAHHASFR